jgi:hypothetical protein
MSYDTNLYFSTTKELDQAEYYLRKFKLIESSESFFLIERNPDDSLNLFIRLQHFGKGSELYGHESYESLVEADFDLAAIRTGRHQQYSVAFGDVKDLNGAKGLSNPQAADLYIA